VRWRASAAELRSRNSHQFVGKQKITDVVKSSIATLAFLPTTVLSGSAAQTLIERDIPTGLACSL
jgi:hypothetical protein